MTHPVIVALLAALVVVPIAWVVVLERRDSRARRRDAAQRAKIRRRAYAIHSRLTLIGGGR